LTPWSEYPGYALTRVDASAQNSGSVTRTTGIAVSSSPVSAGTGGVAVNGGRQDLTVFFSIGVVIDICLVIAFLVWAVGQWRKTKK